MCPSALYLIYYKILMFATHTICKAFLFVVGLHIEDRELKELCLIEIEKLLNPNERSLKDYTSLPCLDNFNFNFY